MDQDNNKQEQQAPFLEVPLSTSEDANKGNDLKSQNTFAQSEVTNSALSNRDSGVARPLNYSEVRRSTLAQDRVSQKTLQNERRDTTSYTATPEAVIEETVEDDLVSRKSSKRKVKAQDLFVEGDQLKFKGQPKKASEVADEPQLFQNKNPYANAWFFQHCFFTWINPLIQFTKKQKKLRVEDLGLLAEKDQVKTQIYNLRKVWNQTISAGPLKKNALFSAVFRSFKYQYLWLMFLNAISACLQMSSPFIIKPLIQYIKDGKNAWSPNIEFYDFDSNSWLHALTPEKQYGISLALLLVFTQGIGYILSENIGFKQGLIGVKSTNALVGLIYDKQMRLSSATNKNFSQGEIITFVQIDAQKLNYLAAQMPAICTLPFTLGICFGLLFGYLGWTFFSGIAVFILSLVVNIAISRCNARNQKKYMKLTDARIKMTTESLNNIKMIKLYSWIDIFKNMIKERRTKELKFQFVRMSYIMLTLGSLTFFPLFLQIVSFTTFIGTSECPPDQTEAECQPMDLALAYTIITIFNLVQSPIRMLPMFIGQFIEFMVAMRRIQAFLICDEINQTLIDSQGNDQNTAIKIHDSTSFHWGMKMQPDLPPRKKAPKKKGKDKKNQKNKKNDGKDKAIEEERAQLLNKHQLQVPDKDNEKDTNPSPQSQSETQQLKNFVAVKNLDIQIKKGEFVCIIGDVGSGKSSLLSALIGDLLHLPQDFMERNEERVVMTDEEFKKDIYQSSKSMPQQAPIQISESVSYVQQIPWIQNKTIRDNITFGQEYNEKKYKNVVKICELERDLEILPSGDQTEIGEKGINLSGGQKARVSLARAVYAEKDIILMDDPISALDANVKKKIFKNVFTGKLKNKTRVLVTHAVDFLHMVDSIILLVNGEVVLQGRYEEIKENPYLIEIMRIHNSHKKEQQDIVDSAEKQQEEQSKESAERLIEKSKQPQRDEEEEEEPDLLDILDASRDPDQTVDMDVSLKDAKDLIKNQKKKNDIQKEKKGKIITNEDDEEIKITFKSYSSYFNKYYGFPFYVVLLLAMTGVITGRIGSDYTIGQWAFDRNNDQQEHFYIYGLQALGFCLLASASVFSRSAVCQLWTLRAGRDIHEKMINRTLHAPVNLYFDVTPIGRILNKFSKDLNGLEAQMGWQIGACLNNLFMLIQVVTVAIAAVKWIGLILPFILFVSCYYLNSAGKANTETQRLFSTTNSPVLSYIGESISGTSTIRAFKRQDDFADGFHELLNRNILAQVMKAGVNGWFSIRIDLVAITLMFIISMICVLGRELSGDPVILSMLLSYVMTVQFSLGWFLKCLMFFQANMVNVNRCLRILEIPQERVVEEGQIDLLAGRSAWPEQGNLEFAGVSLKYRPETEIVLDKLSFQVQKGEKIGVVGRTGAGKSTICLSISRIVEIFEGQIFIDGVDIQKIPLEELRRRITVIPQDPTMFTGTLRFNLDPEGVVGDEEMTELLSKAQLTSILYSNQDGLDQQIAENGANLSSGERQLICICRAILRKSKVVILDEATANIDMVTEQKIQELISTQFEGSTMLTIAHRLNTIIQSDRVLVLSFGKIKEFDSPSNLMKDPESDFSELLREIKKKED